MFLEEEVMEYQEAENNNHHFKISFEKKKPPVTITLVSEMESGEHQSCQARFNSDKGQKTRKTPHLVQSSPNPISRL